MEDIISDFESKMQIIGGEKVYSARDIMKIFGYDKWERFLGAIKRASLKIPDSKKAQENFIFVTHQSTGGRPKEDVYITLGGCYFLLKSCDSRKQNIIILNTYLENLLQEKKQERSLFSFKNFYKIHWEKYFFFFLLVFFCFSIIYYFMVYKNYISFEKNIGVMYQGYKDDFIQQKNKTEEVLHSYDQKIIENTQNHEQLLEDMEYVHTGDAIEQNLKKDMIIYDFSLFSSNNPLREFDQNFNQRTSFGQSLVGEDLIKSFFEFGNMESYRDSCSLLSKKHCLSASKSDLKTFSNFWEKTKSGYTIMDVQKVKEESGKNIYCVKYNYKLKYDQKDVFIHEVFQFHTEKKGIYEQITQRLCEKIEKEGKNIPCPFTLKNYYCK